ncbi:MAG: class I SAM-dependent DNA methyltransferase, partial [Dehalococcoidia bacterium]
MNVETHSQLANLIWSICNLLRGPYKRNEYRKVILPLTVLRRFDCILAPTKPKVLAEYEGMKGKPETVVRSLLQGVTDRPFYNLSRLDFEKLLDDPNQLSANLIGYIDAFSPNVRSIMERFAFDQQIARMAEKNLLFQVIKVFSTVDLSPQRVDNLQMGYVFEELIRIGAEQSNEEAGDHFTPREVIKIMVNLLLSPEPDLNKPRVVKTIYDPTCGTGGMLSVAEAYIRTQNSQANPIAYGQDWNDEAWAICKSDMLIKGDEADNIVLADTFTQDAFQYNDGKRWTFDYMLANPPFGVEWKQQQSAIVKEHDNLGYQGRFGAGLPRVNDGSLLFLQHMLFKMRPVRDGGSRVAIVFNGSPLFTGDAGSGESNIRQWIIESDWLEAVVALPDQLFYNTGISTYIWVLTNRKEEHRKGQIQLIDARQFYVKMRKSLGNKRNKIGDKDEPGEPDHIGEITRIHGNFQDGETCVFGADGNGRGNGPVRPEQGPLEGLSSVVPAQAGTQNTSNASPVRPEALEGRTDAPRATAIAPTKPGIVSKIFDNAGFGFRKLTVERPLRLNFQASPERVARLEDESAFKKLAESTKKNEAARQEEIAAGQKRQEAIRALLRAFADSHPVGAHSRAPGPPPAADAPLYKSREAFLKDLRAADRKHGVRLAAPELKAVLSALSEGDDTAEICHDAKGRPEPDPELRDTESVPLKEDVEEYFKREVLPHVPDAWIDQSKTKV